MRYNRQDIRDRLIQRVFSPRFDPEQQDHGSDSSRRFRKDASDWKVSQPTIMRHEPQPKIIKRASSLVNLKQLIGSHKPIQYPMEPVIKAIWRPITAVNKPQIVRSVSNTSLADLVRRQSPKIIKVPSWTNLPQRSILSSVPSAMPSWQKQIPTVSTVVSQPKKMGKTMAGWRQDKQKISMKGVTLRRPIGQKMLEQQLDDGFLNSILKCGDERLQQPQQLRSKAKMRGNF